MVWTISVIFLSFWLLGITTPLMLHGYIHILLGVAVGIVLLPLFYRKRAID